MGDWTITIHGTGIHHNGRSDDADAIAARAVAELKKNGHHIRHAEIVAGGHTKLHDKE